MKSKKGMMGRMMFLLVVSSVVIAVKLISDFILKYGALMFLTAVFIVFVLFGVYRLIVATTDRGVSGG